jgi:hypothetical protein
LGSSCGFDGTGFSQALAGKIEAISVVDEAVEDGIGEGTSYHRSTGSWLVMRIDPAS